MATCVKVLVYVSKQCYYSYVGTTYSNIPMEDEQWKKILHTVQEQLTHLSSRIFLGSTKDRSKGAFANLF
jgi:hypothetical protein